MWIKELFSNEKPYWISESVWRAWRTFYQTVIGSFLAVFIVVLTQYANGESFNWNMLWLQGVVAAFAAGLAALMNRNNIEE